VVVRHLCGDAPGRARLTHGHGLARRDDCALKAFSAEEPAAEWARALMRRVRKVREKKREEQEDLVLELDH
jgi:hypothetical protein